MLRLNCATNCPHTWTFSTRIDQAGQRVYSEFENPPYFYIMVTFKINYFAIQQSFQAIGTERSGIYTCHVIKEDQSPDMEASVFVDVQPETDSQMSNNKDFGDNIKKSETVEPIADTFEKVEKKEAGLSKHTHFAVTDSKDDSFKEAEEENEIPSKAEIALIVSKSMGGIFRQLADIDQRLKHIENKVLDEH